MSITNPGHDGYERFTVITVVWEHQSYRFTITRGDVNLALGLVRNHPLGLGIDHDQMTDIARRCGEVVTGVPRLDQVQDVLQDVLDDIGIGGES